MKIISSNESVKFKLTIEKLMKSLLLITAILSPVVAFSAGNESIQSFSKSKKNLERMVYQDHRETLYCGASFDNKKMIYPKEGFVSTKYKKRANRVEWEHVVPAENFGRTFSEWRDGHESCINRKGKAFKGRSCASKINMEYRYIQSDMYNLFPSIGSVNAARKNYNFVPRVDGGLSFGSCAMKIDGRKVEPPEAAKGRIARTYLYMDQAYKRYNMSKKQKKLMTAWDKQHPVSEWECLRAERIKRVQGNVNAVMAVRCN